MALQCSELTRKWKEVYLAALATAISDQIDRFHRGILWPVMVRDSEAALVFYNMVWWHVQQL